jgi:hypothetical protein
LGLLLGKLGKNLKIVSLFISPQLVAVEVVDLQVTLPVTPEVVVEVDLHQ